MRLIAPVTGQRNFAPVNTRMSLTGSLQPSGTPFRSGSWERTQVRLDHHGIIISLFRIGFKLVEFGLASGIQRTVTGAVHFFRDQFHPVLRAIERVEELKIVFSSQASMTASASSSARAPPLSQCSETATRALQPQRI
jgi:hypothetical protein